MTEERESPEGDAIFGALNAFSQTKGSDCEVICKNTNMKLPWGFPTREILPSRSLWNHGVSFTKCFLKQSIPFAFVAPSLPPPLRKSKWSMPSILSHSTLGMAACLPSLPKARYYLP